MLRNFVDVIGIADPSEFPAILPTNPNTQYIIQEELIIPAEKPDVEQIISTLVEATVTNSRVIATPVGIKVVVDGELNEKVIYTALEPAQSVHSAHYMEPFCTFIEIPLIIPAGMSVTDLLLSLGLTLNDVLTAPTQVLIEDVSIDLLDPRTIDKCVVLFIWATIDPVLVPVLAP